MVDNNVMTAADSVWNQFHTKYLQGSTNPMPDTRDYHFDVPSHHHPSISNLPHHQSLGADVCAVILVSAWIVCSSGIKTLAAVVSVWFVPEQTQAVDTTLIRYWTSVVEGGATSNQRWVLCLLVQDRRVGGGVFIKADTELCQCWGDIREVAQHWQGSGLSSQGIALIPSRHSKRHNVSIQWWSK